MPLKVSVCDQGRLSRRASNRKFWDQELAHRRSSHKEQNLRVTVFITIIFPLKCTKLSQKLPSRSLLRGFQD